MSNIKVSIEQLNEFRALKVNEYEELLAGKRIFDKYYPGMTVINDSNAAAKIFATEDLITHISVLKRLLFHQIEENDAVVLCLREDTHEKIAAEFFKECKLHYQKMFLSHR